MPNFQNVQPASKLGRSIVTQVATAQTNASQFTTYFGSQQVRINSTLALWITLDSTAVVTANSASALVSPNVPEYFAVTPGQVLNFISTSTSTGYVVLTAGLDSASRLGCVLGLFAVYKLCITELP
jgi:hypothetical protein